MRDKSSSDARKQKRVGFMRLNPRSPSSQLNKKHESGNIFFALFGAIALVGIIGASTIAIMRGPLSTMVEVQNRTKAESEMAIASRLALLEATELSANGDCDADGFVEPLEFMNAAGAGPTGGGFLPAEVSSARLDPWGTEYGYCAWDAGNVIDFAGTGYPDSCDNGGGSSDGNYNRLSGNGSNTDDTYTIVAIISAGANQTFETTCTGGANPDVAKGGDDIVVEYTYETAVTATNGLWNIKAGEPGVAEIDKEIEVSGNIDLNRGGAGTGQLQLGAGSMIYPDQTVLSICPGIANVNVGLLRMNTSVSPFRLEICDTSGWVSSGGTGIWTAGTGNDIYYNLGTPEVGIGTTTPSHTLEVVGTFDNSGAVTFGSTLDVTGASTLAALNATGAVDFDSTFNVDGASTLAGLTATGAVDFDSTLNVDGASTLAGTTVTTLNATGAVDFDSTLNVDGASTLAGTTVTTLNATDAVDLDSTLNVDGATTLGNTLDAQGAISNSGGNVSINDSLDVVNDLDVNGNADIDGTMEADDYTFGGVDFTPNADCDDATEKITWTATSGWSCSTDENDGSGIGSGTTIAGVFELDAAATPDVIRMKSTVGTGYTDMNFVFGSPQLDDDGDVNHDNRLFFDKTKGAFRFGTARSTQWDSANVGPNSFAGGWDTTASGFASFAFGNSTTTSSYGGLAVGTGVTTSGGDLAFGLGKDVNVTGSFALGIGLGDATGVNPVVSADHSFGIFMGDQGGYNLATANRMALVGGQFLIDDAGASGSNGCLRYNGATSRLQFSHDCTSWSDMAGSTTVPGADTQVIFNDGGAFGADAGLTYAKATDTLTVGNAIKITGQAGNAPVFMNLDDLGDVNAGAPTDGQCLVYNNGAGEWVSAACTSSGAAVLSGISAAVADNTIANGIYMQNWNWALTGATQDGFTFGETSASINGVGGQSILKATTVPASTAIPMMITNLGNGLSFRVNDDTNDTDTTPFVIDANGNVGVGTATPGSKLHVFGYNPVALSYSNGGNEYGIATSAYETGSGHSWGITTGTTSNPSAGVTALGVFVNNAAGRGAAFGSSSVTTGTLIDIGHSTSAFSGNMMQANLADGSGSFSGNFIRFQNNNDQKFYVADDGEVGAYRYCDEDGNNCFTPASVASTSVFEVTAGADPGTVLVRQVTATAPYVDSDFVFGSPQMADDGDATHDNRMFFDKSKGAFRVGTAEGTEWNDANVGIGSVALGYRPTASGAYSIALGIGATATSYGTMAIGTNVSSNSGAYAISMGHEVTAPATYSMAIGLGDATGTYPTTTGQSSFGIFMGDQSGYNLSTTNTMALVGGSQRIHNYATSSKLYLDRSNGTAAAPTALSQGDWLGSIIFRGERTSDNTQAGGAFIAAEKRTTDTTQTPMDLIFGASYNHGAGIAAYERMRITKDGNIGIGDFRDATDTIDSKFHIQTGDIRLDGGVGNQAGCIRYDDTTDKIQYSHDCSTFADIGAVASGALAINDLSDAYSDYVTNFNMYLGSSAGVAASPGRYNIALGQNALMALDTTCANSWECDRNTAIGYNTLKANTVGADNVAIGTDSLKANTSGIGNIGIGYNTLSKNTTGSANYFAGNIAIGGFSLTQSTTAEQNTAVGTRALELATGSYNTGFGAGVLGSNTSGGGNTAIGRGAGSNITTGSYNVMIGQATAAASATGSYQLNIGGLLTGTLNTGLLTINGTGALAVPSGTAAQRPTGAAGMIRYNTDTSGDTLEYYDLENTAWKTLISSDGSVEAINDLSDAYTDYVTNNNFFLGHVGGAGFGANNVSNTSVGVNALDSLDSATSTSGNLGKFNTAVGRNALTAVTNGFDNTAIGSNAGDALTGSGGNVAIGSGSLGTADTSRNTSVGAYALGSSTGSNNTVLGNNAASYLRSGDDNVVLGKYAGRGETTNYTYNGTSNVIIGNEAALNLDANNNQNTIIGASTAATLTGGGSGNILLGYGADVPTTTTSNHLNIGSTIYGDTSAKTVSIGTTLSNSTLTVLNSFNVSNGTNSVGGLRNLTGHGRFEIKDSNGVTTTSLGPYNSGTSNYMALGTGLTIGSSATARGVLDLGYTTSTLVVPVGTDAQRPVTPAGGMVRYNTDATPNDKIEYYDAETTAWVQLTDGSSSSLWTDNTTHITRENFNILDAGTTTAAAGLDSGGGAWTGVLYHADKNAIAGGTAPLGLDESYIGANSLSWGYQNYAGGDRAITLGSNNLIQSTVGNAIAIGRGNGIGGDDSIAIGLSSGADGYASMAFGHRVETDGDYSMAFGIQSATQATRPVVSGTRSIGIFNDGGVVDANSGLDMAADDTYAIVGAMDFIVGSYQLDDTTSGNQDNRMFFDHSKGAFRAGIADDDQWDAAYVGNGSVAFGGAAASGPFSFAIGENSSSYASGYGSVKLVAGGTASGSYSFAVGPNANASGDTAIAMGRSVSTTGDYSMAIGLTASAWPYPEVSGTNSFGIFMGDQSNYDLAVANRMGLVGGHLMIDDAGATGAQGCIRYDGTNSKLQYSHDCTTYADMGAASGMALNDLSDAITDYTTDHNMFIGSGSGANIAVGGQNNLAVGENAGTAISTGSRNTVLGIGAGSTVTTSGFNTIIGFEAQGGGATPSSVVTIGMQSYSADYGVAVGTYASSPSDGISIGSSAGYNSTTTDAGVNVGSHAGFNTTTGNYNTALGGYALYSNNAKHESTAVGYHAMYYADSTGTGAVSYNTALGAYALRGSNTAADNTGTVNTAIGHSALLNNTSGNENTAIGAGALISNTDGHHNNASGGEALYQNTVGSFNVALGSGAMYSNLAKSENTAVGYHAMLYASDSPVNSITYNTAIGTYALQGSTTAADNTGTYNTAIGHSAMTITTSGSGNTALGSASMDALTTGNTNTAVGEDSLGGLSTGNNNAAFGSSALLLATSDGNAAFGFGAGASVTSGGSNTLLGADAGNNITTGGQNIIIGNSVAAPSATVDNQLNIGNTIYGNLANDYVGIGNFSSDTIDSTLHLASGDIRLDGGADNQAGCIRYDDTTDKLQYSHDCTTFADMGAASGMALNDLSDAITAYPDGNMFLGAGNGDNITTGTNNTSLGNNALAVIVDASGTTAIGQGALGALEGGSGNTALGNYAMSAMNGGSDNTAIGGTAGGALLGGNGNTAIGSTVMYAPSTRSYNTAMGFSAMEGGGDGSRNTAIGVYALQSNGGREESTAVGYGAMRYVDSTATVGTTYNTALGYEALRGSTTAADNTGIKNTAIGHSSLISNTSGERNTALGSFSMENNTTGAQNTALGEYALGSNTSGGDNIAVGIDALSANNTGGANVSIGNFSLSSNTAGNYNVAIGYSSGFATTGSSNVAIGNGAIHESNNASNNTAIGASALYNVTGGDNTALGNNAGSEITSGTNNTILGNSVASTTLTSGANNILIGTSNTVDTPAATTSNHLNIGNTIYGDLANDYVGIGAIPAHSLDINFNADRRAFISTASDQVNATIFGSNAGILRVTDDAAFSQFAYIFDGGGSSASVVGTTNSTLQIAAGTAGDGGGTSRLFLTNTSRLGLSDSTPDAHLEISASAGAGDYFMLSSDDNNDGDIFVVKNDGDVGIGIAAPTRPLHVEGDIAYNPLVRLRNSNGNGVSGLELRDSSDDFKGVVGQFSFDYDGVTEPLGIVSNDNDIVFVTGDDGSNPGTVRMRIDAANGYIGIGNAVPTVALDVTGDIEYTGTITDVSDMRLKDNIKPLVETGSLLERIDHIDTYSFSMKDDKTHRTEYGVMAQELEKIFPELVHTAKDEMGTKSVNYVGLIAPMIEGMKELKAQNAALQSAQADTNKAIEDLGKQVALLNDIAGNNVGKASTESYWMLLLGLLGGIGFMLVIQRRKA